MDYFQSENLHKIISNLYQQILQIDDTFLKKHIIRQHSTIIIIKNNYIQIIEEISALEYSRNSYTLPLKFLA